MTNNTLFQDTNQEDHLLETDVMRFMAIIGLVFWILFSLVKTAVPTTDVSPVSVIRTDVSTLTPPAVATPKTAASKPVTARGLPLIPEPVLELEKDNLTDQQIVEPESRPEQKFLPDYEQKVVQPEAEQIEIEEMPEFVSGLQLQFASSDDMKTLMDDKKITIFARAKATGFDLYFASKIQSGKLDFESVRQIPEKMWEILSGRERDHFLYLLSQEQPAVKGFAEKQIFVVFIDSELEVRFEEDFARLQTEGKSGVLSVNGSGEIGFKETELRSQKTE